MKSLNFIASIFLAVFIFGCASTQESTTQSKNVEAPETVVSSTKPENKNSTVVSPSSSKDAFQIQANIPFASGFSAANNVKEECTILGSQFSNSILKYAPKHKVLVNQVNGKLPEKGKIVKLAIQNVYSGGNAFIGHRKSVTIAAILYIDGKEISRTSLSRDSTGGVFGGFKGSCSVLAHTVNTLGSDVGRWLSRL